MTVTYCKILHRLQKAEKPNTPLPTALRKASGVSLGVSPNRWGPHEGRSHRSFSAELDGPRREGPSGRTSFRSAPHSAGTTFTSEG